MIFVVPSTSDAQASLDSLPSDILFDPNDPRHTGLGKLGFHQIYLIKFLLTEYVLFSSLNFFVLEIPSEGDLIEELMSSEGKRMFYKMYSSLIFTSIILGQFLMQYFHFQLLLPYFD